MGFAEKREHGGALSATHAYGVTAPDLSGRNQIREWLNEQTLYGALQMASSVSEVRTLRQQELASTVVNSDGERLPSSIDAFLNHIEFDVNDPVQFIAPKRFEDHDLVQTVYKLRRESFPRRSDAGARHAAVEFLFESVIISRRRMESQFWSAD